MNTAIKPSDKPNKKIMAVIDKKQFTSGTKCMKIIPCKKMKQGRNYIYQDINMII